MTNINTIILLIYLILYQKPIQPEIQAVSTPYIQLIDGNEEQNKAVDYLWTKAHTTFYAYDHRFEKRITQHFMISPELDKSVR